jgi:hypothetical protein
MTSSSNPTQADEVGVANLKLSSIEDDKPVKLTVDLPPTVHRDLLAYAAVMAAASGQPPPDPTKLVAPMLARFMATDRAFAKLRRPGTRSDQLP